MKMKTVEGIYVPDGAVDFVTEFKSGMQDRVECWRSTAIEIWDSSIAGAGIFAATNIEPGEVLAVKTGHVVSGDTVRENAVVINGSHQQIGIDLFLAGLTPEEVGRNLIGYNHSCDPNAKIVTYKGKSLAFLVSRDHIQAGREITADYAVSQNDNTHYLPACNCGSPQCRGIVAPAWDWRNPDLQEKYKGEFAWFIQNDIDRSKALPQAGRSPMDFDPMLPGRAIVLAAGIVAELDTEARSAVQRFADQPMFLSPFGNRFYPRGANDPFVTGLRRKRTLLLNAAANFCMLAPLDEAVGVEFDRNQLMQAVQTGNTKELGKILNQEILNKVVAFAAEVKEIVEL